MKSRILAVALVVLMVVGALVLASCGGCPGDGNCKIDWKNASISDATSYCGYGITDADDAKTAAECVVYKDALKAATLYGEDKTSECDCS